MSLRPRSRPAPGPIVAAVFVVAILLVLALAAATGTDIGGALRAAVDSMFPPAAATDRGDEIRDLYDIVFYFAAVIFIVVEALIIWTVVRYRRRPGDDDLPPQTHGNNLAETLWTVIPTVIVAYLFFISWQTLNRVDAVSEQPGLQVRATAGQFQWTFDYLAADGTTVEYKQLVPTGETGGLFLPVGEPVLVQLESPDVVHAFYVPRFLFKRDVVPGQTNQFEFTINEEEAGQTFRGQCAELCGTGHRIMTFEVHALTRADFDAWLEEAKASAQPSGAPPGSLPPNSPTLEVGAQGTAFDKNQLEAPAGQPFAIHFVNRDPEVVPHDIDLRDSAGQTIQDLPIIQGGQETTYTYEPLDAGEYTFICSIHPVPAMTGTLTVK
jgi:cytochrome c oxidase subunit 2